MPALKITPKQTDLLVSVFQGWGQCFHGFSVHGSLLRDPTVAEISAHFRSVADELRMTHGRLVDAVTMCDYAEAERLASHARHLESSLNEEDREYGLYCLTDEAKALAEKVIARRALVAQQWTAETARQRVGGTFGS